MLASSLAHLPRCLSRHALAPPIPVNFYPTPALAPTLQQSNIPYRKLHHTPLCSSPDQGQRTSRSIGNPKPSEEGKFTDRTGTQKKYDNGDTRKNDGNTAQTKGAPQNANDPSLLEELFGADLNRSAAALRASQNRARTRREIPWKRVGGLDLKIGREQSAESLDADEDEARVRVDAAQKAFERKEGMLKSEEEGKEEQAGEGEFAHHQQQLQQPRRYRDSTVLVLRRAANNLCEEDFRRVAPGGKYIEGWGSAGSLLKGTPKTPPPYQQRSQNPKSHS